MTSSGHPIDAALNLNFVFSQQYIMGYSKDKLTRWADALMSCHPPKWFVYFIESKHYK